MLQPRQFTWAVLTTAFTVAALPVRADKPLPPPASNAVITNDLALHDSLTRLFERSASWRAAVAEVERLGRKAVVVTPRNVRVQDPETGKVRAFEDDVIAEVQPLAEHETRVDAVVVVVNLRLLEAQGAYMTPRDFEEDLDRILAHEVFGHAIPYLLAGDLSGKCGDPVKGQRAEDACAIKRENVIRAEMRLGNRTDYGLNGLSIARRYRD